MQKQQTKKPISTSSTNALPKMAMTNENIQIISASELNTLKHSEADRAPISSGFDTLDKALQGGWPSSGVVELNCQRLGTGELRLLLPALSHLSKDKSLQAWVNPPARLNAQALLNSGINLDQTIVVQNHPSKNTYWAVDQLLRSGACSAVIFWCGRMNTAQAKRLQIQAKQHGTLVFAIKVRSSNGQSLPISVRMELKPCAHGLWINIFKRQNAWPVKPFELSMTTQWPWLTARNNPLKQLNYQLSQGLRNNTPKPSTSTVLPFPKRTKAPKHSSLAR